MQTITIMGINFNYDDGYENDCTSVEVNYIANGFVNGFQYGSNEMVTISHDEYSTTKEDKNELRKIVAQKDIEKAQNFIAELEEYKNSLEPKESDVEDE